MKLRFLGATRQVTGSCYRLEAGGLRLLIDCGLFQEREFRGRNWDPLPASPETLDALLLTHAHLDHSGLIPKLVRDGFAGRILTTAASQDLAAIILADAGKIQEEDAAYKRKRHKKAGHTPPRPVMPLYTADDVQATLPLFEAVRYDEVVRLNENVSVTYRDAGHILGSALLEIEVRENGSARTIVFSGDIGQCDKPIIRDPTAVARADYVIMESTYGGREHGPSGEVQDQLAEVIDRTVEAGGNIIIPTFAVERAQELIYHLGELRRDKRIPHLMIFLDSPMAVNVTDVFRRHRECLDAEAMEIIESGHRLFKFPGLTLVSSKAESKAINRIRGTCIILSASGMCTAGRIKHHLAKNISRPESTVVFVGYQARGTLGRLLVDGRPKVRIHGQEHEVRARITQIHGFSAHADHGGLLEWLGALRSPPQRVFLTHGEEQAADALAEAIRDKWGWSVEVPEYQAEYELD